jgi:hypothetical protein
MTELVASPFRTVDPSDAIPNGAILPYYLGDRKLRVSIARVDGRLYAFDDLCTCTDEPCPLSASPSSCRVAPGVAPALPVVDRFARPQPPDQQADQGETRVFDGCDVQTRQAGFVTSSTTIKGASETR